MNYAERISPSSLHKPYYNPHKVNKPKVMSKPFSGVVSTALKQRDEPSGLKKIRSNALFSIENVYVKKSSVHQLDVPPMDYLGVVPMDIDNDTFLFCESLDEVIPMDTSDDVPFEYNARNAAPFVQTTKKVANTSAFFLNVGRSHNAFLPVKEKSAYTNMMTELQALST